MLFPLPDASFSIIGLPENPETKRRLKNLLDVTGLAKELANQSAEPASREDLLRVHTAKKILLKQMQC